MARFRIETFIAAPIEVCFNLSLDIDFHVRSLEHTGEVAVTKWVGVRETCSMLLSEIEHEGQLYGKLQAMKFREPFAAYNAASNIEAHLICEALASEGIEALAVDDISTMGVWWGGTVPELHKPQVWIERSDADRAKTVLDAYEKRSSDLRKSERASDDGAGTFEVACEECGKKSLFTVAQKGTVQTCPHCWSFMDVEDESGALEEREWGDADDEDDEDEPAKGSEQ